MGADGARRPQPARPRAGRHPAELGTQHRLPLAAGVGRCGPAQERRLGGPLTGVQSYSLHALEDLYHTQGYPTPAPYPFTSFMTMSNDPPPKVGPFSQDEGADTSALQDTSPWTKEDGSLAWGTYECRRAY